MDGHSCSGAVTVLMLAALTSTALGQSPPLYFEDGKSLVLTPPKHDTTITSVGWSHDRSLVLEWVNNELELFRSFKGRTELDESTAKLTVNHTSKSDGGVYRVEINNVQQSQEYMVIVIKKVPKPSVVVRTPSCGPTSKQCNLTCQGDPTGTEPVTYSWRKDSGEWEPEQKTMDLPIDDLKTGGVKQIWCRMKNPVSEDESDPLKNPLYREDQGSSSSGGLAAGIICFLVFAGVLAGLAFWKRDAIKNRFCADSGAESSGEVGLGRRPSVDQPLNEKANQDNQPV